MYIRNTQNLIGGRPIDTTYLELEAINVVLGG